MNQICYNKTNSSSVINFWKLEVHSISKDFFKLILFCSIIFNFTIPHYPNMKNLFHSTIFHSYDKEISHLMLFNSPLFRTLLFGIFSWEDFFIFTPHIQYIHIQIQGSWTITKFEEVSISSGFWYEACSWVSSWNYCTINSRGF